MNVFKRIFNKSVSLDGMQLAHSPELKEYAQIHLLAEFTALRTLHDPGDQQRWSRALPQPYIETIALLEKQGWLDPHTMGEYVITPAAQPIVAAYQTRLAQEKAAALEQVRDALTRKETSTALDIRHQYEARFPLGEADWTGDDAQLSRSSLTRRIFFLDHWLLEGLSSETVDWLKQYAAEQHVWGAYWQLPEADIPPFVKEELAQPEMAPAEAAYWRAYQLALLVDNQETWQRCKGGDHVRRIEIVGPNDEHTCDHCRATLGQQFLVARVPELPHRACTSTRGCRCRYEPVLESMGELDA